MYTSIHFVLLSFVRGWVSNYRLVVVASYIHVAVVVGEQSKFGFHTGARMLSPVSSSGSSVPRLSSNDRFDVLRCALTRASNRWRFALIDC